MKVCKGCSESLPVEAFAIGQYGPTGNPWRRNRCQPCYNQYMREYKDRRGYRYNKDRALKQSFGITIEDYDMMMAKQSGVCAICEQEDKNFALSVDHDHATGAVRGLLCSPCNRALGLLKESPKNMLSMIDYINQYKDFSYE